jgi:hypothetical protein
MSTRPCAVSYRSLVQGLDLLPGRPRPAQRGRGGSGIALGEQDGARGVGGHGVQEQRHPEVNGDLRQLVGRGSCRRDVVCHKLRRSHNLLAAV